MRGARAVIPCLLAALAPPGCVGTAAPVAVARPRSGLDAMAYGIPAPTAVAHVATILVAGRWF